MSEAKDKIELEIPENQKRVFESTASIAIKNTNEYLVPLADEIFGSLFDDFSGSVVKQDKSGRLTISLYFAQTEQSAGGTYAFKSTVNEGAVGGYERILRLENRVMNGNKFAITDEAKEVLAKFMVNELKSNNGEVNWGRLDVVSQYGEMNTYGSNAVYNVVNFIDPVKLIRFSTSNLQVTSIDEAANAVVEDCDVEYAIGVLANLFVPTPVAFGGTAMQNPDEGPFLIQITRVNKKEMQNAMRAAGWNTAPKFMTQH